MQRKKYSIIFSIFLITVGFIMASSNSIQQKVDLSDTIDDRANSWVVSGLFEENEKLGLYFVQPKDWSFGPYPDLGEPPYSKRLIINVTNVAVNNFTLFEVILAVPQTEIPPKPPYAFMLTIYDVILEKDGGLITGTKPKWTGQLIALGIAKCSGNYIIETKLLPDTVIGEDNSPKKVSPPLQLVLYKVTTKFIRPYTYLLPLGGAFIFCGIIFSIWSAKSQRENIKRKLRKSSKR